MSTAPILSRLVRLILSLLVAALVVVWLVSTRIPGAVQEDFSALDPVPGNSQTAVASPPAPPRKGALYIWRDDRGVTHIKSEPPPENVQPEVLPFERRPAPSTAAQSPQTVTDAAPGDLRSPLSVYTPDGIDELVDQVEETARQLDQRNKRLEELSKQL